MVRAFLTVVAILTGIGIGLGGITFGYAQGASYLTNDPAACANCHVMQGHYDDWRHSIASARSFQRKAQFLVDFIEAESSMGFHAPQEAARVVRSVDYSRQGQAALRGGTLTPPVGRIALNVPEALITSPAIWIG